MGGLGGWHGQCHPWGVWVTVRWLPGLHSPHSQVPKVPKLLPPAFQLQFSADSESLFVASTRGSVHVFQLLEPGGCKHLHTLQPPSGVNWGGAGGSWAPHPPPLWVPKRGLPLYCPERCVSLS